MKKITLISLFLAIAAYAQQLQRIAIMGTEDDGEPPIGILEQRHLTDKLREIAGSILPKNRYGIMTQQSIVDRLGSEEQAVKLCRESVCLADLGRKVNADYIAQARLGRFEGDLTIKVELYMVGNSNLIGSFTGDSKNAKGLLSLMEEKAPALFKSMINAPSNNIASNPAASPAGRDTLDITVQYSYNEPSYAELGWQYIRSMHHFRWSYDWFYNTLGYKSTEFDVTLSTIEETACEFLAGAIARWDKKLVDSFTIGFGLFGGLGLGYYDMYIPMTTSYGTIGDEDSYNTSIDVIHELGIEFFLGYFSLYIAERNLQLGGGIGLIF